MRLSTKSRFAITSMIDVALRANATPVPLSEIAARHHISLSYLEQVFSKLRQHGLVESTRGPGGGYTLGQRADKVTVADIIGAVEDEGKVGVRNTSLAGDAAGDLTRELCDALNSKMVDYMQSITLRSLAAEQRAKGFKVEERTPPTRGVFKKPKITPLATTTPNSVFALGRALLARG